MATPPKLDRRCRGDEGICPDYASLVGYRAGVLRCERCNAVRVVRMRKLRDARKQDHPSRHAGAIEKREARARNPAPAPDGPRKMCWTCSNLPHARTNDRAKRDSDGYITRAIVDGHGLCLECRLPYAPLPPLKRSNGYGNSSAGMARDAAKFHAPLGMQVPRSHRAKQNLLKKIG